MGEGIKELNLEGKKLPLKLDLRAITYLALFIVLIFLSGGLLSKERGILKVREVTRIKAQFIKEIEQLEKTNQDLETEILSLRRDPFWIEKIAREELDMVRPGEIVIKFHE